MGLEYGYVASSVANGYADECHQNQNIASKEIYRILQIFGVIDPHGSWWASCWCQARSIVLTEIIDWLQNKPMFELFCSQLNLSSLATQIT